MNEASSDSSELLRLFSPFHYWKDFLPVTDAMEMLRASSVMQNIKKTKELYCQSTSGLCQ